MKNIGRVTIAVLLTIVIMLCLSPPVRLAEAIPRINIHDRVERTESMVNPNSAFGTVYWVDAATGDDTHTGLTPELAFASITTAITASNLTCGSYNMNTIYVNAGTYTEDLTVEPRNVNIIGIGSKTRLQGTHVFDTGGNSAQHCHW